MVLLLLFNSFEGLQEERFLLVGIVLNGGIVVPVVILGTNLCSWFTKLSLARYCREPSKEQLYELMHNCMIN